MRIRAFEAVVGQDRDAALWTPAAVSSLVGQRFDGEGELYEVVAARKDRDGRVFVTLRVGGR